jgi:hypothetical protein
MAAMKRMEQRTLELIFARPVSGNLPWRDIEAQFHELGGDGHLVAVVLFGDVKVFHRPDPRPIQTKVLLLRSASGLKNTE